MALLTAKREKYTAPWLEAEASVPDILCDSNDFTSGLEDVGEGDSWTF